MAVEGRDSSWVASAGAGWSALTRDAASLLRRLPFYREHNVYVFLFFLVFIIARYMQWGARREILSTLRVEYVLGVILCFICLLLLAAQPLNFRDSRRMMVAIGLLFAVMIVQIPFAADQEAARSIFTNRVIKFAFMTFFMAVLIQSPRYLRFFLYAFLFACFYITQESVRGLISGGLVWENQGVLRLHGAVPIYSHPNSLGGLAMGAIPFVVFLFPVLRQWYVRCGLLALCATSIICVIYSGSRTAYVAFATFLLFWWFMSRHKLRWVAVALLVGALGLVVVPGQYKERFMSITGEEAEGQSKAARILILEDAVQIFLENPFGVGVASFPAVRMARFGREQDTHNLYLEVATNLGVQGLLVFLFLVAVMLASYRRAYQRFARLRRQIRGFLNDRRIDGPLLARLRRHDWDLRFLMAVAVASAGFIYVRLMLGLFGMDLYEPYWWFGAGMVISLFNIALAAQANTRELVRLCEASTDAS